jgi:hypothetical protein
MSLETTIEALQLVTTHQGALGQELKAVQGQQPTHTLVYTPPSL